MNRFKVEDTGELTPPTNLDIYRNSEITQATIAEHIEVQINKGSTEFVAMNSAESKIKEDLVCLDQINDDSINSSDDKQNDLNDAPFDSPNLTNQTNDQNFERRSPLESITKIIQSDLKSGNIEKEV